MRIRFHRRLRGDDGVAMLFVIAIGMVATLLVVAMLGSVLADQKTTQHSRNITSAQAAAEAGLDDAVYQLGNYASGTTNPNWNAWPTQYTSEATALPGTLGNGATYKAWFAAASGNYAGDLIAYVKGTYGGNTRTVRAILKDDSPQAFDYSMFASTGIDIHHHGDSYLSPQAYTTAVHSNGYIKIDYPAEFTVNSLEAVGNVTFGNGGGSDPAGNITAAYNWFDPLSNQCFPGGYSGTSAASCTQAAATAGGVPSPCPSTWDNSKYGKYATIFGTVRGGSVTVNTNGEVWPVCSPITLGTGSSTQTVAQQSGDVYAGTSAKLGSTTYSTAGTYGSGASTCTQCSVAAPAGGQIGGKLYVGSQYTPPVIQFPSIDYSTTYRSKAILEGATTHFWNNGCKAPDGSTYASGTYGANGATGFLTWLGTTKSNWYVFDGTTTTNGAGHLVPWNTAGTGGAPDTGVMPDAIVLTGDYDICGSSLTLSYSGIQAAVKSAAGVSSPTTSPTVVISGSLVVETGGLTLNSGLVVVGNQPNVLNLLNAPNYTSAPQVPLSVNVTNLLDSNAVMPGVVATGGQINSTDYDTDKPWSSTCNCYQPKVATPIYIRGLVYAASYNATTKTSTPQNQHWHNFDPKNLMKIYGSQVGSDLHDCNNFTFSYDPLVKKAFGFGGGTVTVVSYQELGT